MNQIIIVCDERGNPTGQYIPKMGGVSGNGVKHLAVTVFLYNKNGEILLQKRKHLVFDSLWDLTASTDLSHFDRRDESFEEAVRRCLKREYEIDQVANLKNLGGFSYFAKDGEHCENEYDVLFSAQYDGEVNLNPDVGYEYKWVSEKEFLLDLETDPKKYTPWVVEAAKIIRTKGQALKG